jgi:hypothetical protein
LRASSSRRMSPPSRRHAPKIARPGGLRRSSGFDLENPMSWRQRVPIKPSPLLSCAKAEIRRPRWPSRSRPAADCAEAPARRQRPPITSHGLNRSGSLLPVILSVKARNSLLASDLKMKSFMASPHCAVGQATVRAGRAAPLSSGRFFGASSRLSRCACLRASLRARRTARSTTSICLCWSEVAAMDDPDDAAPKLDYETEVRPRIVRTLRRWCDGFGWEVVLHVFSSDMPEHRRARTGP